MNLLVALAASAWLSIYATLVSLSLANVALFLHRHVVGPLLERRRGEQRRIDGLLQSARQCKLESIQRREQEMRRSSSSKSAAASSRSVKI